MIHEEDILLIYHKLVIDIIDKGITTFNAKQFGFRDKNVLERWCENAPRNPTDLRFLKTLNKVYQIMYSKSEDEEIIANKQILANLVRKDTSLPIRKKETKIPNGLGKPNIENREEIKSETGEVVIEQSPIITN